jgi:hypothetical protein
MPADPLADQISGHVPYSMRKIGKTINLVGKQNQVLKKEKGIDE